MIFKKHWDVQDKLREIHEALGGDGRLDFYEIACKKKCGICGDEYYARRKHARYCSQKCRNERNAEWRREQRAREKAERLAARQATCRQCGKAYIAKRRTRIASIRPLAALFFGLDAGGAVGRSSIESSLYQKQEGDHF